MLQEILAALRGLLGGDSNFISDPLVLLFLLFFAIIILWRRIT